MTTTLEMLDSAMSHAAAPAFFLGAVTGLVSIILTRLNGVMAELAAATRAGKRNLPIGKALLQRAQLLHSAVSYIVAAGVCTTTLLALTFLAAFVHFTHLYLGAVLFIGSTALTAAALLRFYQEVRFELHVLNTIIAQDSAGA